jgi:phage baseplate assembly protein W
MEHIDILPESELKEILQCVKTILVTDAGNCPFARDIGVKADALHRRMPVAQVIARRDVYTAIEDQEERAIPTRITFKESSESVLVPKVEVVISG